MSAKWKWSVALIISLSPVALRAHHSFAAEFDVTKPVTLTGTVTKIEWTNPHARFYIDVKDGEGRATAWELELGSINGLMRSGWNRATIKPGDLVTVEGTRAKDGSNLANARMVKVADGRNMFGGSANEPGESKPIR